MKLKKKNSKSKDNQFEFDNESLTSKEILIEGNEHIPKEINQELSQHENSQKLNNKNQERANINIQTVKVEPGYVEVKFENILEKRKKLKLQAEQVGQTEMKE